MDNHYAQSVTFFWLILVFLLIRNVFFEAGELDIFRILLYVLFQKRDLVVIIVIRNRCSFSYIVSSEEDGLHTSVRLPHENLRRVATINFLRTAVNKN